MSTNSCRVIVSKKLTTDRKTFVMMNWEFAIIVTRRVCFEPDILKKKK